MRNLIERLQYWLICGYLLSQTYLVPLVAIGPGWPIWPTLADFMIAGIGISLLIRRNRKRQQELVHRSLWTMGIAIFACCLFSYGYAFLSVRNEPGLDAVRATLFGALQLLRVIQCLIIFRATIGIHVNNRRRTLLKVLSLVTYFGIVAGVVLTYSGIISTVAASRQLPTDLLVAGPWAFYSLGAVDQGVGFIGYNHAYTAIQLILAAGIALTFNPSHRMLRLFIMFSLIVCTFVSGSREGFLCALLLVVMIEIKRGISTVVLVGLGCLILAGVLATQDSIQASIERQKSSMSSMDDDGLSGRTTIWQERIAFINERPVRWLLGTGFGSAAASGVNAHMLPLHLILETGLVGLAFFGYAHLKIVRALMARGENGRTLKWTTIALLVSAATQETLYPVVAFPNFESFFIFAIALGLNQGSEHLVPKLQLPRRRYALCGKAFGKANSQAS